MTLLDLPTDELTARARVVRAATTGTRVTYSPKVFIPLTRLCRDRCGYCTFATAPRHVVSPYLTPDEVLAIASRGAEAGCHEALFTLGEAPEERYAEARAWLDSPRLLLDGRLPRRDGSPRAGRDRPAAPHERRRDLRPTSSPGSAPWRRPRG